jgi:PqqD family protein of HPr-rel-A system
LSLTRYHVLDSHLIIQPLDYLYAVYDRASGRTHLITDVAHALLQAAHEPSTIEILCDRVRSDADIEVVDGGDVNETLRARANELIELELLKLAS